MIRKRLVVVLLALPFLGACESYFASKPEITGGVLCNVLGRQVVDDSGPAAATSESVQLGRFLGRRIGREVYLIDELKTAEALESSCDGHATTWRNTDTGQRYSVTPTQTYRLPSGRCRDFTTVAENEGREQVIHGKACRQPDGTWKAAELRSESIHR
jgi:surface antigen